MKRARMPKEKLERADYRRVWPVVDGAVRDAIAMHPEFFADAPRARYSIVKRVTGNITSYLAQARRGLPADRAGG